MRVEDVFELNKSESCLDDQPGSRRGRRDTGNESATSNASFSGTESDRTSRRERLRERLRAKGQRRNDNARLEEDEDSDEGSVYLPANMNMRSLSPMPRSTPALPNTEIKSDSEDLMSSSDMDSEDDAKRRSSGMSSIKKKLKNKVKSYRNIGGSSHSSLNNSHSSATLDSASETEDSVHDPYNKTGGIKPESKGVSKTIKGLFGKGKNKKHLQMLGGSESDSDYSADR